MPAALQRPAVGFIEAAAVVGRDAPTRLPGEDVMLWGDGGGDVTAVLCPHHGRAPVGRVLLSITRQALPGSARTSGVRC